MTLTGAPRYEVHVPHDDGRTRRAVYVAGETVAVVHRDFVPADDLHLFKTRRTGASQTPVTDPSTPAPVEAPTDA